MYRIFMLQYRPSDNDLSYDPIIIYDDENSDPTQKLISPVLTLEDNAAGSLTFTMPIDNAGYERLTVLRSTLIVKRRVVNPAPSDQPWETIWEGRVISEKSDFYNQRSITCEGALAYLNDMYVLQWNTLEISSRPNNPGVQFKVILKYLLQNFNDDVHAVVYTTSRPTNRYFQRTYDRRIFINEDDVARYYGSKAFDFSSKCESLLSYISNAIIGTYGGHVKLVKRAPTNGEGSDQMVPDPTDIPTTGIKKGLCLEYVEEYYSPDIGEFSSQAYSQGDHTIYQGNVYRFVENHAAGAPFDSDEVEQIPNVKVSKIAFKKNLIDLKKEFNGADWCTAVLITGGANEEAGRSSSDQSYYTVKTDDYPSLSPTDQPNNYWGRGNNSIVTMAKYPRYGGNSMVRGYPTTSARAPFTFANEVDYDYLQPCYIVNRAAAEKYGLIAAQENGDGSIKNLGDDEDPNLDYSGSAKLYNAGVDYLKLHDPESYSIDITALDFNFVDRNTPFANIGDIFYVDSSIHDMDDSLYFILTKLTIPLDSPESTTFTLNRSVTKSVSSLVVRESRFSNGGKGFGVFDTLGPEDPNPDVPIPYPDPEPEPEPESD